MYPEKLTEEKGLFRYGLGPSTNGFFYHHRGFIKPKRFLLPWPPRGRHCRGSTTSHNYEGVRPKKGAFTSVIRAGTATEEGVLHDSERKADPASCVASTTHPEKCQHLEKGGIVE